jgi:hypothetical protein
MTECQFWIQTGVQVATVVATLTLAGIAIWGEAIRAKWLGPRLTLRLFDPQGERIDLTDGTPSRWYHLRAANERRSAHAVNVRVVLTKVSRPSADGHVRPTLLSGPIQLTWQHGHSLPQYPTLGPALNADLGFVTSNGVFRLTPVFVPNNLDVEIRPGQRVVVEALAISDQAESRAVCVEIAWDGVWSEDATEMGTHLVVKEVGCL